jgi:hypothetical protein
MNLVIGGPNRYDMPWMDEQGRREASLFGFVRVVVRRTTTLAG